MSETNVGPDIAKLINQAVMKAENEFDVIHAALLNENERLKAELAQVREHTCDQAGKCDARDPWEG